MTGTSTTKSKLFDVSQAIPQPDGAGWITVNIKKIVMASVLIVYSILCFYFSAPAFACEYEGHSDPEKFISHIANADVKKIINHEREKADPYHGIWFRCIDFKGSSDKGVALYMESKGDGHSEYTIFYFVDISGDMYPVIFPSVLLKPSFPETERYFQTVDKYWISSEDSTDYRHSLVTEYFDQKVKKFILVWDEIFEAQEPAMIRLQYMTYSRNGKKAKFTLIRKRVICRPCRKDVLVDIGIEYMPLKYLTPAQ